MFIFSQILPQVPLIFFTDPHTHTPTQVLPAVILADEALVELVHHGAQHGAGIVGKVQVSDLHDGNRDDGKGLLILLSGTRPELEGDNK